MAPLLAESAEINLLHYISGWESQRSHQRRDCRRQWSASPYHQNTAHQAIVNDAAEDAYPCTELTVVPPFYPCGLKRNPRLWRNLAYSRAAESGPVSLWYRVPVWTFVSAVHLQTRLVLAETVKLLEQTPSAHNFSIHSDPLSLAFVSDVMRKHVNALKLVSCIWTLHWVLVTVLTAQDSIIICVVSVPVRENDT